MELKITRLIEQYNATGRIAFYHPKKHTISLNGFKALPEEEGLKRIEALLYNRRER